MMSSTSQSSPKINSILLPSRWYRTLSLWKAVQSTRMCSTESRTWQCSHSGGLLLSSKKEWVTLEWPILSLDRILSVLLLLWDRNDQRATEGLIFLYFLLFIRRGDIHLFCHLSKMYFLIGSLRSVWGILVLDKIISWSVLIFDVLWVKRFFLSVFAWL